MRTRIQFLWLSVLLALTALAGLTWVQIGLLRDSTALKQQILDAQLRSVLVDVVRDLETMEMASAMPIDTLRQFLLTNGGHLKGTDSTDSGTYQVIVVTDSTGRTQQTVVGRSQDSSLHYRLETELIDELDTLTVDSAKQRRTLERKDQSFVYRAYVGHTSTDSAENVTSTHSVNLFHSQIGGSADNPTDSLMPIQDIFISQVIHRLTTMAPRPLKERVNQAQLDSLFDKHLRMAGITLEPVFAVYDSSARILFASTDSVEFNKGGTLAAPLFPFDMGGEAGIVKVRFPGQEAYLWQDRWSTVAGSAIFMSMLAATVALGLIVIRRQDRVRQRTQEFIANLTHEFTTPVSTIQLAVEALSKDPSVGGNERSSRMVEMIGSENRRMRAQVQKILQLAQLEEGGIELSRERIDLNDLIRTIAASFHLTIEQRQGVLTTNLSEGELMVRGDRTHLGNLISNLIDNAIKYSPAAPVVTVTSSALADVVQLSVSDQGVGISTTDQSTIFQKFVRGSTGNIHDVKGFGIGLSYVKAVVVAHGGTVSLASKLGVGTTIAVSFPYAHRSIPHD